MGKLIAGPAVIATIVVINGCTIFQPPETVSVETTTARQNVKLYDVIPPNGTPIEQISATACNGTREAATDKLIALTSQRGGNGIAQLLCSSEGFSFSCWSSTTCTATAINVVTPPPPPPTLRKRAKPKAKKT
jgi:hypothetical protein